MTIDHLPFSFTRSFHFIAFASSAGGLRNWNAAAFASLKKSLRSFFNPPRRTEPKEAAYPVTGENSLKRMRAGFI
ncbi:MAG: hypothetical protein ABIN67_08535, partial [Ferruginibacter sp.]